LFAACPLASASRHCILHLQYHGDLESFAVLEDLSTFGTFVDKLRVSGLTRLNDGCEVALSQDYRYTAEYIQLPKPHQDKTKVNGSISAHKGRDVSNASRSDNVDHVDPNSILTPDSFLTPWGVRLRRSLAADGEGAAATRHRLDELLQQDADATIWDSDTSPVAADNAS
jgi:hypothetical protein